MMTKDTKRRTKKERDAEMTAGSLDSTLVYHLWEGYSALLRFMDKRSESPLHSLSLTQWRTLNLIFNNPGRTQSAFAREIGITRASMSAVIDYFEKMGLLERKPAEKGNAYALSMSDEGNVAIKAFYKEIGSMEKKIGKSLGREKIAQTIELLYELRVIFDDKS